MSSSKKIKVLEVIRQGCIGGGESHLLDLIDNLDKSFFEPIVLSFSHGKMIENLNSIGVRNYVIRSGKPFDITKWAKVRSLIRSENIDVVHAHGTRANTNVLFVAKYLNIPIIYTIHGWSFHDNQHFFVKKARIFTEEWLTRNTDYNICVSESNQNTGKQLFKRFDSILIKNGINLIKFNPNQKSKNVRNELKISEDVILIGYIARITIQKDPFTLLKGFEKALRKNNKLMLLIVGEGDLKNDVIKLAEELLISNRVIFENFRQDIPDILSAIDIYCLPSLWEGLPIGVMEAMAMKKAIIATKVDGTVEIISNRFNGILIPARRPLVLAEHILELADDNKLRVSLGKQAQKTVTDLFSAKKMTEQVERIYLRAINY